MEQFQENSSNYDEKYTLNNYLEYQNQLKKIIKGEHDAQLIFNDSFVHAEMIISSILKKSSDTTVDEINMYCGNFSLFRDIAKNEIEKIKKRIKPNINDEHMTAEWERFNPYDDLIKEFNSFMEKGNRIYVIVEKDISNIKSEFVWEKGIGKYVKNGQLVFKKLGVPVGLNHFFVAGNSYRLENDDSQKTAICCFNDEETCKKLKKYFQTLSILSLPYNLINDNGTFC